MVLNGLSFLIELDYFSLSFIIYKTNIEASDINLVDIRRSAAIPEVVRRLTMDMIKERLTDEHKRTLTDEEHRSLMGISISPKYQSWLDMASGNEGNPVSLRV